MPRAPRAEFYDFPYDFALHDFASIRAPFIGQGSIFEGVKTEGDGKIMGGAKS
jgi:hypothetical protein